MEKFLIKEVSSDTRKPHVNGKTKTKHFRDLGGRGAYAQICFKDLPRLSLSGRSLGTCLARPALGLLWQISALSLWG